MTTRERLVLGLVSGGGWEYVQTWYSSLRRSGYGGEVVLITSRCAPDLYERCAENGVTTVEVEPDELLTPYSDDLFTGRHLPMSRVLGGSYRDHLALVTDVRDVFFQKDPFEFLEDAHGPRLDGLTVSVEDVAHDHDSMPGRWNAVKLQQQFSKETRESMKGQPVYNAGIVAGPGGLVADLFKMIYLVCFNARHPGDQAALNMILRLEPYRSLTTIVPPEAPWVAHFAAIQFAGVPGDRRPVIEDGLVTTVDGKAFHILHQYDRAREVKKLIESRLADWESETAR
jgi:hypothetical protein